MGSGYKQALNLVLTSDRFNTETMLAAETQVVNGIKAVQQANADKITTFNMTVTAQWEALPDDTVIDTLRRIQSADFNSLSSQEKEQLLQETLQAISSKQDPRRCKKVTYEARVYVDSELDEIVEAETDHGDKWLDALFN
jgi:hypothetical protein